MKNYLHFFIRFGFCSILFFFAVQLASAQISGTRTVGAGGNYATVGAAIADIQTQGLNGALTLELLPAYTSAGETFPLNFTNLTGISAANTLTLRPQAGATNRVITGSNTTAIVNLDNAQFVTIDGRAGGSGTAKDLTIQNTNTVGATIRFINEASNNTVKHTTVKGVVTSVVSGVILFSTTTGANGNDNNTIDNCDIQDGATTPTNGILSQGTTTTTAHNNSNNTISNNNIFNFYASVANDSSGVRLNTGSTDWTITGNSLFQTATRAAVTGSVRGIFVNNISGANFTVTNNFIGGSQANAGGTPWTTTGTTVVYRFVGISMGAATSSTNSIQGNTVRNIVWTSSSTNSSLPGVWCGIFLQSGSVNVGTTAANTIGNGTGTGSIVVTTSGNLGATIGIGVSSGNTINVSNNTIGSITTNGTTTSINHSLIGILSTGSNNTISNNTIGSTTTANSLNAATSASFGTVTGQQVAGIQVQSNATITGNTISNLNNNYVGTASVGQIRGIVSPTSTANVITGNTVRNLTTTSANTGTKASTSVIGISQVSAFGTQNHTVSNNTVHTLSNTSSSAAVEITGILFDAGTSTGTNIFNANFIHSLTAANGNATTTGLAVNGGKGTFTNNVIRLGIDSNGNSITLPIEFICIHGTGGRHDFLHNSLYIGGTNVAPFQGDRAAARQRKTNNGKAVMSNHMEAPLVALDPSFDINDVYSFKNNVLKNDRSAQTLGSLVYTTFQLTQTSGSPKFISNHNIYHVTGTNSVLFSIGFTNIPTLNLWQGLTGQDGSSFVADPLYSDPTAGTPNLRPQPVNPLEGAGLQEPVPFDFDGLDRPNVTPVDIGAHAGLFTSTADLSAPFTVYPRLSDGSINNRILSGGWLTVTDNVGIAGGAFVPRIYYSKDGINYASQPCVEHNGLAEQTKKYDCVIDYVDIGGVELAEVIFYHVAAQDFAGNVVTNPPGGTGPNVTNIKMHPPNPNTYTIVQSISGTKTVGGGGNYTSLTGIGGLFQDLNSKVLTGDVTVLILDSTTEDGTNGLNKTPQNNFPYDHTVTIKPADPTPKILQGNVANGLFRFNGASKVTIDGSFNGAGRFLTFRNEHTANPTVRIDGGAHEDLFRFVGIEGANTNTSSAVVHIQASGVDFNDEVEFDDVIFRDLGNTTGVPANLLLSQGATDLPNKRITVRNSEFFNFTRTAIQKVLNQIALIQGNKICTRATVSFNAVENDFTTTCLPTAGTTNMTGISFSGDGTVSRNGIELNSIGTTIGIEVSGGQGDNINVSGNRVLLTPTGISTNPIRGVELQGVTGGTLNLFNNQITINDSTGSDRKRIGIFNLGFNGGTLKFDYNSVLNFGIASGSNGSSAFETSSSNQANEEHFNNIYWNAMTGGTSSHNSITRSSSFGTFISDFNAFAGNGALSPENHFSITGSQFPIAVWRSITSGDTNSLSRFQDVSVIAARWFVDFQNGNLIVSPGAAYDEPLDFSNRGTPRQTVFDDFDFNPRSTTTPDIGSSEYDDNRTLTTNGTLLSGNYDNITAGTGFSGNFGGGVNVTLGGIINVSGTMSVSCDSMLLGASSSNYVIGNLKKDFCAPGAFDFPVGTTSGGNEYSPVTATVTNLATKLSSLAVKANKGTVPATPPLADAINLDRFWTLTETGDLTANLLFNYLQSDVDGNENMYRILRVQGTGATQYFTNGMPCPGAGSPCVDTGANTMFISGVTNFSNWAAGIPVAPTAASVSVGGWVSDAFGNHVARARVMITNQQGVTQTVTTNFFGYYRFEDVPVGETYIFQVRKKNQQFTPQTVTVTEEVQNLNFAALP